MLIEVKNEYKLYQSLIKSVIHMDTKVDKL